MLVFYAWLASAYAEKPLVEPTGHIVLLVAGGIAASNSASGAQFDMQMLESLGDHTLKTETSWTEGVQTFEGPLLRDIMKLVGAKGKVVKAFAINDYSVEIPMADFEDYPVILARRHNGKEMSVREKGPLWVIYPWSDFSELRNEKFFSRSIWQVNKIEVK